MAWRNGLPDGSEQPAPEGAGLVSAEEAQYQPPESGPFECSNCMYFVGDNQPCQKVADPVMSEGCCNLFQSAGAETQADEHSEAVSGDGAQEPEQTGSF